MTDLSPEIQLAIADERGLAEQESPESLRVWRAALLADIQYRQAVVDVITEVLVEWGEELPARRPRARKTS